MAQKITPNGRFEAEKLTSVLHSVSTPAGTEVRYILEVDSDKVYWNGTFFKHSNGTFEQSNTKQELEDNCIHALDHSSFVKLIMFLKTSDDTASPELTSVTLQYEEDVSGVRGYLNSILLFIGAESLTDEEFEDIDLDSTEDPIEVYNVLLGVLESRELISEMSSRLQDYFTAQGVAVTLPAAPVTNIFVGGALE